jgi:shikimate kinase
MKRMSIVLIGYRGCGKTTIGKRLADRLWQPFVDVDDLIVKKAGKNIRQIFEQDGEAKFRDLESEAVREVCKLTEHVIGLGGGTLGREENRKAVREVGHKVIYLKCDPAELHRRIQADPQSADTRPNLTSLGGTVEEIQKMLAEREPIYRQVKHAELDVTHLSPEDAVVYIVRLT